jgi:hypothetical protein
MNNIQKYADPNCESCEGMGIVADILESENMPCVCVNEYKAELQAEALMDK